LPGVFENLHEKGIVNGSIWTLAYEFLCYIFLVLLFRFKILNNLWIFGIFLAALLYSDYYCQDMDITIPFLRLRINLLLEFTTYFFEGTFFYLPRKHIKYKSVYFYTGILLYLLCLSSQDSRLLRFIHYTVLPYSVFYLAISQGILNNWGKKFGDLSYGIYIYGYVVQQSIIEVVGDNISNVSMLLLSFLFVLPFSWFSWHFIEEKALQYKKIY
jgi:peptidoglycan/LPS O-acetylase OafA/YrhL